jgi:hypothetical protein
MSKFSSNATFSRIVRLVRESALATEDPTIIAEDASACDAMLKQVASDASMSGWFERAEFLIRYASVIESLREHDPEIEAFVAPFYAAIEPDRDPIADAFRNMLFSHVYRWRTPVWLAA